MLARSHCIILKKLIYYFSRIIDGTVNLPLLQTNEASLCLLFIKEALSNACHLFVRSSVRVSVCLSNTKLSSLFVPHVYVKRRKFAFQLDLSRKCQKSRKSVYV